MASRIRFGILGPGKIAHKFCESLQAIKDQAEVYAVASRDEEKARTFATRFKATKHYNSYEALAQDPLVDIIYVATPHPFHYEQTKLCLLNKKAVLCEKPLTLSYAQTKELYEIAQRENVFLMEAMWSRFIPALVKAKEIIDTGTIGEIKFMHADFGFISPPDPGLRTFNKALGGSAQLDVGVYPTFLALWFLGKPEMIKTHGSLASTDVDNNTTAMFCYSSGASAIAYSSFIVHSVKDAVITGTKGSITIHGAWHKATSFTVTVNDKEPEYVDLPYKSNGLQFQAVEAIQCFREGKIKSDKMTPALSMMMAEASDTILTQLGVTYS